MADKTSDWHPWDDYKGQERPFKEIPIPIAAPPCPTCIFWLPVIKEPSVHKNGRDRVTFSYEGVTLCHAADRYGDFSCYEPRSKEAE